VSLALGTGAFAKPSAGVFNFVLDAPAHIIYWEDYPRRMRAVVGGRTVADSDAGKLLHETGILPVLFLPERDFDPQLLEPTDHTTHCPFKGDASYWTIRVGDREIADAVWGYPEPLEGAPPLAGYRSIYWHMVDEWHEEGERLFGHLRDPYHRVDVRPSTRHVRVAAVDGTVIAESQRPKVLYETGLAARYYVPREDADARLLTASDKRTVCPYKGEAAYWSVRLADGGVVQDAAWSYDAPLAEAERVAGHLSFQGEGIETTAGRAA
jgi:uncharacterized protein (DUF427 family)